jgi:hypothetical protein
MMLSIALFLAIVTMVPSLLMLMLHLTVKMLQFMLSQLFYHNPGLLMLVACSNSVKTSTQ